MRQARAMVGSDNCLQLHELPIALTSMLVPRMVLVYISLSGSSKQLSLIPPFAIATIRCTTRQR